MNNGIISANLHVGRKLVPWHVAQSHVQLDVFSRNIVPYNKEINPLSILLHQVYWVSGYLADTPITTKADAIVGFVSLLTWFGCST